MKIVYFIPLLGCGGAEILLGATIEQLVHKKHEVLLITLEEDHPNFAKFPNRLFIESNVRRHVTRARYSLLKTKQDTQAISDLERLIQSFSPDIIHSHLFQAELVSRLPKIKNCMYFSHGHDNMWQLETTKGLIPFSKAKLLGKIEARWLKKKYSETNTTS